MKVYILDWHGTLTHLGDLKDIKAFLDKLHALGHYTIGYSGMPPKGTRGWFTFGNSKNMDHHLECLAIGDKAEKWETFDGVNWYEASRFMDPKTDYKEVFDPSVITEVVYSDDQPFDTSDEHLAFMGQKMGRPPVRFVRPQDLHREVET